MKRLRSREDNDSIANRSLSPSSHRSFCHKLENVRKGLVSPSSSSLTASFQYNRDRTVEDDTTRKRSERDFEGFDPRKGLDHRYRGLIHRSESFCGSRREFRKGFRSERGQSRREGSVSSWRRGLKDFDENGGRGGSRVGVEEGGVRSSPNGLRDSKSPALLRDSESEQSNKRCSSSPRGLRESKSKSKSKSKSPTWSKNSDGEQQSKSVEVKRSEELLQVESGNGSEMEEGELEPEPGKIEPETAPNVDPESEGQGCVGMDTDDMDVQNECQGDDTVAGLDVRPGILDNQERKPNEDIDSGGKDAAKEADELLDFQDESADKVHAIKNGIENVGGDDNKEECLKVEIECKEETKKGADIEKAVLNGEEHKQNKGVDIETRADVDKPELTDAVSTENEVFKEMNGDTLTENLTNNAKDKGKSVSVTPIDVTYSSEDGLWIDRGLRDLTTCSVDVMEGPSTRGFELFSRSPVRKAENTDHSILNKQNDGNLAMEQLDLSLSLPNVLLPIGVPETTQVPGSRSQAQSMQSLNNTVRTNSDCFTASMSFSGSQSFYHNPSCSLTQNSLDYEQTVGSRPLFQGIDQVSQGCWLGKSQNDPKQEEVPFYQRTSMNGNGSFYQCQASLDNTGGQAVKGQHSSVLHGSSKMGSGLDRQLSFHKQLSGKSACHDDVISPSQSVGSHDIGSSYSFEKKMEMRDRSSGSLYQTTSQKEQEQLLKDGVEFFETFAARIVAEPVLAMSRKFREMSGQSIACLKEGIHEIMLNADKQERILVFQKVLQIRIRSETDMNLEVLLKCHRVQLEILVALITGLTNFLHLDNSISSSDLAEIFLNLRCRNLMCRSQLPVDECDCKVCVQKNGFCRECMCLVCSKFDNASNTCSWVGCDVCLHWCHTDCGLRESYIRNGHSATRSKGLTEMQFHCTACDLPSEMFGFVKEVFQNFAKEWSVETLCKELEYVKRIFSASKDTRGRQLHEIADQMLPRLANKSNLPEVFCHIMSFLADGDSSKLAMTRNFSGKEQLKENNGVAGPTQEEAWLKSLYSEKPDLLERPANILPSFDQNDKRILAEELQMSVQKDFCFDELESVVNIKLAEAKMYQARADDARREAEALKRIILAKNEKTEEYTSRITKLQLAETEEMHKQKFEELQAIERSYLENFNMKLRMEADIKDLLSNMEATKKSLAI